jgi:hypothetical protein
VTDDFTFALPRPPAWWERPGVFEVDGIWYQPDLAGLGAARRMFEILPDHECEGLSGYWACDWDD